MWQSGLWLTPRTVNAFLHCPGIIARKDSCGETFLPACRLINSSLGEQGAKEEVGSHSAASRRVEWEIKLRPVGAGQLHLVRAQTGSL